MILATLALVPFKPKIETIFFVTSDCPIARRFTPEIKRIMKEYKPTSTFRFEYEDSGVTLKQLTAHHAEYNIKCPLSFDKDHILAKKLNVLVVPTAVIRTDNGQVLYQGRIDDSYGTDFKWHPAKNKDLRNALTAIKNGEDVPVKSTKVIGCTLSL